MQELQEVVKKYINELNVKKAAVLNQKKAEIYTASVAPKIREAEQKYNALKQQIEQEYNAQIAKLKADGDAEAEALVNAEFEKYVTPFSALLEG